MLSTLPDQFSEPDSEQAVLAAARKLTNATVALSEKISDRFENARQMRKLLGATQDLILRIHDIFVELATGSDEDNEKLRKKTYGGLARWVRAQVQAHGEPSLQRWEADQ